MSDPPVSPGLEPAWIARELAAANPFRATDLWNMSQGLVLLERLRAYGLAGDGMEWHLPPDVLPGVTSAWGLPVRRVPDLPGPYLAHSLAYGVEP